MFQEEVGQGCEWAFVYLAYVFLQCTLCTRERLGLYRMYISTRLSTFLVSHIPEVYKTKKGLNIVIRSLCMRMIAFYCICVVVFLTV